MLHRLSTAAFASLALLALAPAASLAGDLSAHHAMVREMPPGARVTAAFMVLRNAGDADIAITAVSSPAFGRVEMHRTQMVDGVARMVPQDNLPVPAGGELVLEHGSWHLMLFQPQTELHIDDEVEFTAETGAGSFAFSAKVTAAGHMQH